MTSIEQAVEIADVTVPEALTTDDIFAAEEWTETFLLAAGR